MVPVCKPLLALTVLTGIVVLSPEPAAAHHAFAAEFEANNRLTLTGTVTRLEWLNPHARLFVDVKGARPAGEWEFVLGSPNVLIRRGWEKTFVKVGDVVTITGFQARDGSRVAAARTIVWADGRTVSLGDAGDGGPAR